MNANSHLGKMGQGSSQASTKRQGPRARAELSGRGPRAFSSLRPTAVSAHGSWVSSHSGSLLFTLRLCVCVCPHLALLSQSNLHTFTFETERHLSFPAKPKEILTVNSTELPQRMSIANNVRQVLQILPPSGRAQAILRTEFYWEPCCV